MKLGFIACAGALLFIATSAGAQKRQTLDIYFVDVEGGQATLFVTPERQSLLIDTGWPDNNSRDAKRIVQVAKLAGIAKIDTVIITHYHDDHVGGLPQLAALIPIGTVIDHGELYERCPSCVTGYDAYTSLVASGKLKRHTVAVGDHLAIKGLVAQIVSSNGAVLSSPLPGAGQNNAFCRSSEARAEDTTENGHSVGTLLAFGKFRAVDLGDLTWDREMKMMCPVNRLGTVSLLIVSHHGWMQSSSPAFVDAVRPQIAITDNGATKGGSTPTLRTINAIPGLAAAYQLHFSEEAGLDNAIEAHIANIHQPDAAFYLKVSASRDGSFTVFNPRTGATDSYPAR